MFKINGNAWIPVGCRLQLHSGENPLQSFKASGVSKTQVELRLRHLVVPSGEPGSRQAAVLSCFPRSPGVRARGQQQQFASLRRSSNSRLVQSLFSSPRVATKKTCNHRRKTNSPLFAASLIIFSRQTFNFGADFKAFQNSSCLVNNLLTLNQHFIRLLRPRPSGESIDFVKMFRPRRAH